jgi:hypothetical protein
MGLLHLDFSTEPCLRCSSTVLWCDRRFADLSRSDLEHREQELADMEEEMQAMVDRLAANRSGLTRENARRSTAKAPDHSPVT